MAIERLWEEIPARAFTADGQANGIVTLESTIQFRVKQKIKLTAIGKETLQLQVKRVISTTQMILGPDDNQINSRVNLSSYTLGLTPMVSAPEQNKTSIPDKDQAYMTLEREPVNARRVFVVDDFGNPIGTTPENPLHTQLSDGSINIGTVNAQIEVQLTHRDNDPEAGDIADSVRIGDGVDELEINPDGSINTVVIFGRSFINVFNEISNIPKDTPSTIATYTVIEPQTQLHKVTVSGENIAKYTVKINNQSIDSSYTYFGGDLNTEFDFTVFNAGYELQENDIITIEVEHKRPNVGNFNARIQLSRN